MRCFKERVAIAPPVRAGTTGYKLSAICQQAESAAKDWLLERCAFCVGCLSEY